MIPFGPGWTDGELKKDWPVDSSSRLLGSSVELYHAEQQAWPGPVNQKDEEETVIPEGSESFGEEAEDEGLPHEERCQVCSFSQELASRAMMPAAALHMFSKGSL